MENASWKDKEPTEKQIAALINMRHALGCETGEVPKTRGEASDEISKLQETILHNLSVGGSVNPRRSVYASHDGRDDDGDDSFGDSWDHGCWSDFGNN